MAVSSAAVPYPALRRSALATGGVFALSGAVNATWVSRLPEVRESLHTDTGSLGLALLATAIGTILSAPLTGRMARRFGSRAVIAVTCPLTLVALVWLGFAPSVPLLAGGLFVLGLGYGSWDVAMNIHGHAVESAAGRAWMPRYHAAWSAGGFAAAGIGAGVAALGLPVSLHFLIAAILDVGGTLALLLLFRPDSGRAAEPKPGPEPGAPHRSRVRLVSVTLVLMGVVMACATMVEGAANDWLAMYLDDVRKVPAAAGAAGYTIFAVAMAVSRGAGTWLISWLGRGRAVRASALLALAGIAMLLLVPVTGLAYVGAVFWGLGIALVFPAVISAAGDSSARPGEAIAAVTPIGYAGFLVGPPLVGLLARQVGLGVALWAVAALAAVMAVLAGVTRERRPAVVPVPAADLSH